MMQLFLSGIVIASGAVLVRNLLYNFPRLEKGIRYYGGYASKAITCGFCFTYWLALVYVSIARPLDFSLVSLRFVLYAPLQSALVFLFEWLAVGFVAVVLRFGYVVLQELVNYQVHQLGTSSHQHHHDEKK